MKAHNLLYAVGLTLMMPVSAQATGIPVPDVPDTPPPAALQDLTINGHSAGRAGGTNLRGAAAKR